LKTKSPPGLSTRFASRYAWRDPEKHRADWQQTASKEASPNGSACASAWRQLKRLSPICRLMA
jgi:hypothetical protein